MSKIMSLLGQLQFMYMKPIVFGCRPPAHQHGSHYNAGVDSSQCPKKVYQWEG